MKKRREEREDRREGIGEREVEWRKKEMRDCRVQLESLHKKLCELFEVSQEVATRIWQRYMTNSYELLQNESQTISDAGIYGGQVQYEESVY